MEGLLTFVGMVYFAYVFAYIFNDAIESVRWHKMHQEEINAIYEDDEENYEEY